MKVKLLTSLAGAGFVYNRGDEYECSSTEEAARFVEKGLAEYVREKKIERAVKKTRKEKATK